MGIWECLSSVERGASSPTTNKTKQVLNFSIPCRLQSPGQADSQVDASWKLGSTCGSVWPGIACLTSVEIKYVRKFHRWAIQYKSTQVERRPFVVVKVTSWPRGTKAVALKRLYLRLSRTCEETYESFWPPTQVPTQVQLTAACNYFRVRLTKA